MNSLEKAIELAARAHAGQTDKLGAAYILHPLRVMLRIPDDQVDARVVAVLHDILEDTAVTADELLAAGFTSEIVKAVEALTRRKPDESYPDFVRRAGANRLARIVKRADLADNLDPERLAKLPPDVRSALEKKYAQALRILADGG